MPRHVPISLLLVFGLSGCVDENAPPPPPQPVSTPPFALGTTPVTSPPPTLGSAPPGFTAMTVDDVRPDLGGGWVLTLVDPRRVARVPIFIGESEGQIIQRRRLGLPFERPLTHDLLDDLVRRLGGRVAHVEIGELRGRTFIGTVVVHEGSTIHRVDARSSDAVAIALGHSAPVFVADAVIARAGL